MTLSADGQRKTLSDLNVEGGQDLPRQLSNDLKRYHPHSRNGVNITHYADMAETKTNFVRLWESVIIALRIRTVM